MKTLLHKSETRGHENNGWLNAYHSFSFANYHDPKRMNFGVLRVLNDDTIANGKGFGMHPHDNMEIITIPLEGDLEHKDSMDNVGIIKQSEIQVMSAGAGIYHSEYNRNADKDLKLLQIWVIPNTRNVKPRYDQISLKDIEKHNSFFQILSPNKDDKGVWIHQDAWFSLGNFETGKLENYSLHKKSNGVYIFIIEGKVCIENQELSRRDAIGIWDVENITLNSVTKSRILLMEVPI